jgi:hypothetical protein
LIAARAVLPASTRALLAAHQPPERLEVSRNFDQPNINDFW